jgi:hypothetical protein
MYCSGILSISNKDWLSFVRNEALRISMLDEEPVPPVELITPETLPGREFIMFSRGSSISSSHFTLLYLGNNPAIFFAGYT